MISFRWGKRQEKPIILISEIFVWFLSYRKVMWVSHELCSLFEINVSCDKNARGGVPEIVQRGCFNQVEEKGPRIVSSLRKSILRILSINLVLRPIRYMKANFGCWAMSFDPIEEHDMIYGMALGAKVSSQRKNRFRLSSRKSLTCSREMSTLPSRGTITCQSEFKYPPGRGTWVSTWQGSTLAKKLRGIPSLVKDFTC